MQVSGGSEAPQGASEKSGPWAAFRKLHADLADTVAFQGGHGPGQAVPLHLVADHRFAADLVGDEAAQRLLAVDAVELQAVERGHRRQLGIAFQHEVAEEARAEAPVGRLAEQLAEGRQVVFVADHAENVVGLEDGAARRVEQFGAAEQRGDPGPAGHLQLAQGGADAPLFLVQVVDEQLPLAGRVDLQAGAGYRCRIRRHHHPQQPGRPGQAGALHQQRDQDDEEGHVEEQLGVRQAGHQREHREDDRHRAAQADPGDEGFLAVVEGAERDQSDQYRQRSCHQDHPQRQGQCRQGDRPQVVGGDQQAEDQEHADLRQPGHAVEHVQDAVAAADRAVAEEQAAQVDGEDAAAADGVGQGEHQQAAADHQQRVEAAGQVHAVDQLQQQPAAAKTEQGAETELLHQVQGEAPAEAGLAAGEHLDQGHGEEHRHRVVAARFDFQGRGDPLVETFAAEQGEHRGGVGGADDGADQQAFHPVQVEQPGCRDAGQAGGHQHAQGGQRQCRPERHAEAGDAGAQAAVEEDHGERQVAHQVGHRIVVEDDAADPVVAGDHADGEEDHQDRDAQAGGQRADEDAHADQHRPDQEEIIDGDGVQGRPPRGGTGGRRRYGSVLRRGIT